MKRIPSQDLSRISEFKESTSVTQTVTLPKETLERFQAVCLELDLKTDELLEISMEIFLSSKIWEGLGSLKDIKKTDC